LFRFPSKLYGFAIPLLEIWGGDIFNMLKRIKMRLRKILNKLPKNEPIDYNIFHVKRAFGLSSLVNIVGSKVLVVGANNGMDCYHFKTLGVSEVHGVDILSNTGDEYQGSEIYYHIESAEKMSLPNDMFDLVFCFATMEHIPNIDLAFGEMIRVTKPGGYVYCISAPLWESKYGHHMGTVFGEPWIHLRMNPEELNSHCQKNDITMYNNKPISHTISYMYNPENMNQNPARKYVSVCNRLRGINIISNDLDLMEEAREDRVFLDDLIKRGYQKENLLAVTHNLFAKKSTA
jgi:SAM-dependent methyltransferase